MGQMVDTLATEHQISDGVCVLIAAAPLDRFALLGAHPDHARVAPVLADLKGVAHVDCPLTPDRIELAPGAGLDCDCVGHRFV